MLKFKLFGVNISVSLWFSVLFAAIHAAGSAANSVLFFLSAVIHEVGHLVFMYAVGERAEHIGFYLGRIEIKQNSDPSVTGRKMLLIYLGGIIFNVAAMTVGLLLNNSAFLMSNAALAIFNLLPCNTFDGGRCCELIMEINRVPADYSRRVMKNVSYWVGCSLAAGGIFALSMGVMYLPTAIMLFCTGVKACIPRVANP